MYAGHTPFCCIWDYKLKLYYLLPDELELLVVEEVVLPVVEAFVLLVAEEVLLPVVEEAVLPAAEVFALPVVEALLFVEAGVLVALVVSFFPHPVTSPAVPTASTRAAAKTNFVFFIFLISFFVFVICFLKITVIINSTMRLKSQ